MRTRKNSTSGVTDTPAFRRWFGDSKVVDRYKRPLVVYHGTRGEPFHTFQRPSRRGIDKYGPGFYFTTHQETIDAFGNRIMPVYLRIEHPAKGMSMTPTQIRKFWDAIRVTKFDNGYDATEDHATFRKQMYARPDEAFYTVIANSGIYFDAEDVRQAILATGIDGIIIPANALGMDEYVVFDPRQIKSATENVGTFDPDNADIRHNPVRTRRNSSDEPRVGDQWSWGEHTREIAAIQERNGEVLIGVRESDRPGILAIYGAEEFPAHKAREMAQNAAWEARRPEREREQRERAEREARDAARREKAEAAERSLVARLRAFATSERLTEKQKEKMKVDFRNQVQYKGKVYTIAELIEEKIKVDGWNVDEDGIDGPGGAFIAKKSITPLGLRYAQYLWHKEHPPAPEPPVTARERELMNGLFGVSKPKRR